MNTFTAILIILVFGIIITLASLFLEKDKILSLHIAIPLAY